MGSARRQLGVVGERLAASWYEARGYRVLARNWRCRHGEIDLVVACGDLVVFVEVKNRSSGAFGHPAEAVTWRKQQRLRLLALRWLADNDRHAPQLRFDVVAVLAGRLEVYPGAF